MKRSILYKFKKYETPKLGLFSVCKKDAKYTQNGWENELEEITIIGENDITYVYQLKESEHGEWIGDTVITKKYILPLGVHKSRLVQWLTGQLTIFNS